MGFVLTVGLAFILFLLSSAQTPHCFNLGPFDISGTGVSFSGFAGTLNVLNPSPGTSVQLFINCGVCLGSNNTLSFFGTGKCGCKIVTKLSVGFGATRGLAFTYGDIDFGLSTNMLTIAGGGGDLRGGYGSFTITNVVVLTGSTTTFAFEANLHPCIFVVVNPFLPSVQITAVAAGVANSAGLLKITCGSGNSCTVVGNSPAPAMCSIECIPGETLSVSCKSNQIFYEIDVLQVEEKISYGVESCTRSECTYDTIVMNFDTDVSCTYKLRVAEERKDDQLRSDGL